MCSVITAASNEDLRLNEEVEGVAIRVENVEHNSTHIAPSYPQAQVQRSSHFSAINYNTVLRRTVSEGNFVHQSHVSTFSYDIYEQQGYRITSSNYSLSLDGHYGANDGSRYGILLREDTVETDEIEFEMFHSFNVNETQWQSVPNDGYNTPGSPFSISLDQMALTSSMSRKRKVREETLSDSVLSGLEPPRRRHKSNFQHNDVAQSTSYFAAQPEPPSDNVEPYNQNRD
ncbi:hypothetical protein O181_051693 [Austropuccinia psidii MF-1]|uniref:Uncharacterized protein n=1 Tax=Austropuccinia psidii MF-1 TaxID=1389203 RepID=A0A9Q3E448_9BASI|nr:hypothetical protein [Austropuccinia psidii MF-1]